MGVSMVTSHEPAKVLKSVSFGDRLSGAEDVFARQRPLVTVGLPTVPRSLAVADDHARSSASASRSWRWR